MSIHYRIYHFSKTCTCGLDCISVCIALLIFLPVLNPLLTDTHSDNRHDCTSDKLSVRLCFVQSSETDMHVKRRRVRACCGNKRQVVRGVYVGRLDSYGASDNILRGDKSMTSRLRERPQIKPELFDPDHTVQSTSV